MYDFSIMINKKLSVFLFVLLSLALCLSIISANLDIKKEAISSVAIKDTNTPAIYKMSITNNGAADDFTLASLAGIDIQPNESFYIDSGETKEILMKVTPKIPLKISPDYFSFEYTITGKRTASQTDEVILTYVKLKDAFDISVSDITPDSDKAIVSITNKAGLALENVKLDFSSLFFTQSKTVSFDANEEKIVEVAIDKEKMSQLLAGPYIITLNILIDDKEDSTTTIMNFKEQAGIKTLESSEGVFFHRYEVQKINQGNTKADVAIVVTKNWFPALFTSFNQAADKKELSGLSINYIFRENLTPGQTLDVIAKTNWWILIAIIIILVILYNLIDKYLKNKLVVRKTVSLVRTKGGEFALRVSIKVKARDFVEKIRIYDRLPPMVKVFEKYGSINPDKIDTANRRLEWNVQAMGKGEERIMSYIIYSKIGVVGRFELPSVHAVYEYNGKIKEADSNRAFFKNEPRVRKD